MGYVRVETSEQEAARELAELRRAGAELVFVDHGGAGPGPSQWDVCLERLRAGDTFLVWRLDRAVSSVAGALRVVTDLHDRKVHLRSLCEPEIDTAASHGPSLVAFAASLSALHVARVRARSRAGQDAARREGRPPGRPTVMSPERLVAARALRAAGQSHTAIARALGVSPSTVGRALAREDDDVVRCPVMRDEAGAPAGAEV
ncbi:recombinase family protein [Cellulomonas sp. 179-A 9B4 NHS]|uniref:recombinase family protein n=1 Tax=Cellulomonas sp. 179-A 9B4 NHS TaxID=3142379 RepID=UPI0039A036EE